MKYYGLIVEGWLSVMFGLDNVISNCSFIVN